MVGKAAQLGHTICLLISLAGFGQLLAHGSEYVAGIRKDALLRDAETEETLREIIEPIFKVAGLDPKDLKVYLLFNPQVNAAASVGYRIFLNTGLVAKAESVDELIGVFAHETAHIADGHVAKIMGASQKMSLASVGGMLLGLGTALAGSADGGMAIMMGSSGLATNNFFSYQRGQESIADALGAEYLKKLNLPVSGLSSFLKKLKSAELLSSTSQDAYVRTHPMTADRYQTVHTLAEKQTGASVPSHFKIRFAFMKAKLLAYLDPHKTLRDQGNTGIEMADAYGKAIALYRLQRVEEALQVLDQLIKAEPTNPFFHEQKGQILYEEGRLEEALNSFQKAVSLAPQSYRLKLSRIPALLESKTNSNYSMALQDLIQMEVYESEYPSYWALRANAHGKLGQEGEMALCLSEKALAEEDEKSAKAQAKRALKKAQNPKTKRRAQDILESLVEENE